jgi:regulator of nucleoside diphosphate kinase
MKTNQENPVIISEDDYNLLKPYFSESKHNNEEMSLAYELSRATVVKREAFPEDCIRLNSKVSILDMENRKIKEFTIVMPEKADIKQNKISILTPIAAAIIGFRKNDEVMWKVPAGLKKFKVLDVTNKLQ